jgi:branched-subunit amino acid aminotransferase/4-amino-4-deoxychorismate lyase
LKKIKYLFVVLLMFLVSTALFVTPVHAVAKTFVVGDVLPVSTQLRISWPENGFPTATWVALPQ